MDLVRASLDAVVAVDDEGRVVELDEAAQTLYRVDDAALGRALGELIATPAGPIDWRGRLEHARRHGSWSATELQQLAVDHRVWVRVELETAGEGGFRLKVRPAHGREVLAALGRDRADLLVEAFERGGVGAWFDDTLASRQEWSPSTCQMLALPDGESPNHEQFFARVHPEDQMPLARAIQGAVVSGGSFSAGFRVQGGDGTTRHVETFGEVVHDERGQAICALGGARDCTNEVEMRARIDELQRELERAQRLDALGRLAGGVAHDFNNLLTVVLGSCEFLRLRGLSEADTEIIEQIVEATTQGSELTRQLLAYTRKQPMQLKPVALDPWIDSNGGLLSRLIPESTELRFALDAAGAHVLADSAQLFQVLSNLVSNASQAAAGPGLVRVHTGFVEGDCERVSLSVSDDGPGIDPAVLPHIFEPFYTTKPVGDGTGLGLSTVQGIVEQSGGSVNVESVLGHGTTFVVSLPVCEPETVRDAASGRGGLVSSSHRGALILVVEDQDLLRTLAARALEEEGYRVLTARDGREALDIVGGGRERPALLLTDVVMPRMDGPSLASRLRELHPDQRVAFMSGYPAGLAEPGATGAVLRKPFGISELLQFVRGALDGA